MKIKAFVVLLVLALTLTVAGCTSSGPSGNGTVGSRVGDLAADFTLKDLNGQTVTLSSLRGRPVMLNFWASWCGPCRSEMPDIQAVYVERLATTPSLVILSINLGESAATARQFMEDGHFTFPTLLDSQKSVALQYDVTAIPTTFFIDENGIIIERRLGSFSSKGQIDGFLNQIVDED
ncbi:MAG: TlpA disulfide reductase family protein [Dehalococcoidales bacterium]